MKEKLYKLPEYEKRAEKFIAQIMAERETNQDFRRAGISVHVDKFYPDAIRGLDQLQSLIDVDQIETPFEQPSDLANKYDIESANSCLVELDATFDFKKPLENFLDKVFEIAITHQGQVDNKDYQRPFSTLDKEEYIVEIPYEAYGVLYSTVLHFKFSQKFSGDICSQSSM